MSASKKNGYKDFKWGMTPEQVSELVQTLEQKSEIGQTFQKSEYGYNDPGSSLFFIMSYLYRSELHDETPYPVTDIIGYTNGLTGNYRENGLSFFFSNDKLVGVVTYFRKANIISELEKKYGKGVSLEFSGAESAVGRVWLDNERYIIWSMSDFSSALGVEFVTFLDAEWSRKTCKKCVQDYKKEKQQEKFRQSSRLD